MKRRAEYKNKLSRAFSIAELVIIIGVMALVIVLAVVSLPNISAKGRSIKTLDQVEGLRMVLAQYRQDNGFFPPALSNMVTGNKMYLEQVPELAGQGNCRDNSFEYTVAPDGQTYSLKYCLERGVDQLEYGVRIASEVGLDVVETIASASVCSPGSCGGACGQCSEGLTCVNSQCQSLVCNPSCSGRTDTCRQGLCYCGESQACAEGESCISGICRELERECQPECAPDLVCQQGSCVADCSVKDNPGENMRRVCPGTPLIGCYCGGGTVICNKETEVCGGLNLVVSPALDSACNESEELDACQRAWKINNQDDSGSFSSADGRANHALLNCVDNDCMNYPAFEVCQNLNVNGYEDWYLPAQYEVCAMMRTARQTTGTCMSAPNQSGSGWLHEGQNQAWLEDIADAGYWTSTELSNNLARMIRGDGGNGFNTKSNESDVRCMRRY